MRPVSLSLLIAVAVSSCLAGDSVRAEDSLFAADNWKQTGLVVPRFQIQGTEGRSNPLRRKLAKPFQGDELFVRYRLKYNSSTIDSPDQGNGEFFVFWLDETEGNESSTHSNGVPNLGIHVADDGNRFMVRYSSGGERFGAALQGDHEFLLVGRLWKSHPGVDQPFDQFDLWVDPKADAEFAPHASAKSGNALKSVNWVGFSTGGKTELEDRIEIWDIAATQSWRSILDLPPLPMDQPTEPVQTVSFREDVYPILKTHCFDCHSGEHAEEGVRLDILDEVLNRTAPRNADASRLIQLISNGEMPPDSDPLKAEELAALKTWINEGLHWDRELLPTPVPTTDHWAFQPIQRPEIPKVRNTQWVHTPVDAFIARRHEVLGVQPAPEADAATLARRLSLDLLGLPPQPVAATAPEIGTTTDTVEQLLARPEYGERWGRHWLDLARWAESNGHQHNRDRPHAWRYRDWVINAFNSNKPFDDFLREQIAGDELEPFSKDNLVATGFLAAARYSGNELDKDIQRNDILVDIVNTTTMAFLGLTVECAQCHTHKFDPITIRDYYRFQAFFAKGQPERVVLEKETARAQQLIEERWAIFDRVHERMVSVKRRQGIPEPIYIIPKSVIANIKGNEKARFNELEQQIAALEQTWGYYSPIHAGSERPIAPTEIRWPLPRDRAGLEQIRTTLLIRGDVQSKGPEVRPGWPAVFGSSLGEMTPEQQAKPRTALADWMTSPGNPLTARVWVNRLWQWHFGQGLVETSADFGTQGTPPSHPELLDYLASELIDRGWDTNHIHRLILNSSTYRQSSRYSAANAQLDPDNTSLWRWTPRRIEAEAVRDSILAVAGMLDLTTGGPSVDRNSHRRSVYLKQRRDHLPHQQMLFDSPAGLVGCTQRRVSTSPLQPLWLLNSEFIQRAVSSFAARAETIDKAYLPAFGRAPTPAESAFLDELVQEYGMQSVSLAILNSSEFLYIP